MSNPGQVSPPAARVWEVLIFRARPGHEADFVRATMLYKRVVDPATGVGAAIEKAMTAEAMK